MRTSRAYGWLMGVTLAAVTSLFCWQAAHTSPLDTPLPVILTKATQSSIRQTLDLAGTVTYANQRYAMAQQSGIVAWVTSKGEGELVERQEALVRLDTDLSSKLLAQSLSDPQQSLKESLPVQAAAMLSELDSSVQQLETMIEQCTVRAYEPGQVLQTLVRAGELVQAGSPVALLASATPQIIVSVTPDQRQQLHMGAPVHLYQDNQKTAEGVITSIFSPIMNDITGIPAAQVTISLIHPPALRQGEQVEARIILKEAENIAAIPLAALDEHGHAWQVVNDRAWQLPEKAVLWDDHQAWIPGISVDSTMILNPTGLSHGQRIKEVNP